MFKLVLADRAIFRLVMRNELQDSDFDEHPGVCRLSTNGRGQILDSIRESLDLTEIRGHVGYRSVILREAYKIEAHALEME